MTASSSNVTIIHLTSGTHYFISANAAGILRMGYAALIALLVPTNESTALEQWDPANLGLGMYCTISTNSSVTGHSDPRREDFNDLSQVTTAIEEMDRNFRCLRRTFYYLLSTPQKSVRRDGQDVTPHLRYRRDAHLFVAVTGHKGRRVGRNGTV